MTPRERAVARVVKLRKLASSKNVHESRSADLAAQRLMVEHHLTEGEVDAASGSDYCEVSLVSGDFGADWRYALLTATARHCGAEVVAFKVGRGRRVRVCGRKADVERAQQFYDVLHRTVVSLADEVGTATAAELDAWHRGCVRGVVEILRRPAAEPGLVRTGGGVSAEVSNRHAPRTVPSPVSPSTSSESTGGGASSWWYQIGRQTALSRIVLRPGDVVALLLRPTVAEDFFWG